MTTDSESKALVLLQHPAQVGVTKYAHSLGKGGSRLYNEVTQVSAQCYPTQGFTFKLLWLVEGVSLNFLSTLAETEAHSWIWLVHRT